jgi:hypothetical protein
MNDQTPDENREAFEAEVTIGKGLKRIEPHGSVTVSAGELTLKRRSGEVILQAPVGEVHASGHRLSAGAAARVSIGESKEYYTLSLTGRGVTGVPGGLVSTGQSAMRLGRGRGFTKTFIAAVEAARKHSSA